MNQKYEIGQKVKYHPIIGGESDGKEYEIKFIHDDLVWLVGKSGCVSIEAISQLTDR